MRWKKSHAAGGEHDSDDDVDTVSSGSVEKRGAAKVAKKGVRKTIAKSIKKSVFPKGLPSNVTVSCRIKCIAQPDSAAPYILKRCKNADGKTVGQCLGMLYQDTHGASRKYGVSDLKYDLAAGRFKISR